MPEGIANIFPMPELKKTYRITYDSWEGFYTIHMNKGIVRFYKDKGGLPYIDLGRSNTAAASMLVQTVRGNYEGYTKREVIKAKEACRVQSMLGSPSESDFVGMVSKSMIKNCNLTT